MFKERSPKAWSAGIFILWLIVELLRILCKHGAKSYKYSTSLSPILLDRSDRMPQANLAQSSSYDSRAYLMYDPI